MQRIEFTTDGAAAHPCGVFRAGETPDRMVELYVVPSWGEHLRQHDGRLTGADAEFDKHARSLSTTPPTVAHMLPAQVTHGPP